MDHDDAPNWVAEHLGASSRRPRHPFPALMAGVNPGRVPVYTALKNHPITPRPATAENSAVFCTSGPHALSSQQRHVTTDQELHLCTHHLDGLVTVQIHLPLLTATLVLQLEPGIVVVVWANIVIAAEPVIQHAYTPNDLLKLEVIDSVFPFVGITLSHAES